MKKYAFLSFATLSTVFLCFSVHAQETAFQQRVSSEVKTMDCQFAHDTDRSSGLSDIYIVCGGDHSFAYRYAGFDLEAAAFNLRVDAFLRVVTDYVKSGGDLARMKVNFGSMSLPGDGEAGPDGVPGSGNNLSANGNAGAQTGDDSSDLRCTWSQASGQSGASGDSTGQGECEDPYEFVLPSIFRDPEGWDPSWQEPTWRDPASPLIFPTFIIPDLEPVVYPECEPEPFVFCPLPYDPDLLHRDPLTPDITEWLRQYSPYEEQPIWHWTQPGTFYIDPNTKLTCWINPLEPGGGFCIEWQF